MSLIIRDWASSAGHWYTPDGEPRYSIIGKNGKERATTLRDARVLGLVPSVTTIMQKAAKPGLERWKAEQVLVAALTLPRRPQETEKEWVARVWEDSREQARVAAERGTAIHGAIEKAYRGEGVSVEFAPFVGAAQEAIAHDFGEPRWNTERSFAHPLGFGGKVDLHADGLVLDIKTKEGDLSEVKTYDEHGMQLAAYAHGLGMPEARCGVVFVSRDTPQARIVMLDADETERGWILFDALLDFWMASTGLGKPKVAA